MVYLDMTRTMCMHDFTLPANKNTQRKWSSKVYKVSCRFVHLKFLILSKHFF